MKPPKGWILFVAGRFGSVDRRGRSAVTSLFSTLGIAFGAMTLTVILAVMNGFQQGSIRSILETNSYHVRVSAPAEAASRIAGIKGVRAAVPFRDIQALAVGNFARQSPCVLRALPPDVTEMDIEFAAEARAVSGSFDLSGERSVVLGYELARLLSVRIGDRITLAAVAGGAEADLFPLDGELEVTGLFKTGYYAQDVGYAFISEESGRRLAGGAESDTIGIKLRNPEGDGEVIEELLRLFPGISAESWRTFNRAFFGALKIEKNILMFLVFLIFAVVAVNIYHGMRRAVYERGEDIAVLTALGARAADVRFMFTLGGLGTGFAGSLLGLAAGLFLSVHINGVFGLAESTVNLANRFASSLMGTEPGEAFTLFSPAYFYMDSIPVRIFLPETTAVFLFGIVAAAGAAWHASRTVLRLKPAEVLRNE